MDSSLGRKTLWIQISWIHQKPADLDIQLHSFPKGDFDFGTAMWCTFYIGPGQVRKFYERKTVIISLPINLNMCFGCSH